MGAAPAGVASPAIPAATRRATAITVIIGFTRSDVGKTPESAT